jgi:hypothetical protein
VHRDERDVEPDEDEPEGKQYFAIYSGIGGWMGAVAFPAISIDDPYAALGVVGAMKEIKRYTSPGARSMCSGCRLLALMLSVPFAGVGAGCAGAEDEPAVALAPPRPRRRSGKLLRT